MNQVIGGAVFALPAALAAQRRRLEPVDGGRRSGFASLLIALSFAEVASRFDGTGGAYLYARAAFGRFAAFEVGWLMWFTRAASWASVINVLAVSLGFYWPSLTAGTPRMLLMTAIMVTLAAINIRGIRQSSFVSSMRSPSARSRRSLVFIAAGLFVVDWSALPRAAALDGQPVGVRAAADLRLRRLRGRPRARRRGARSEYERSPSRWS